MAQNELSVALETLANALDTQGFKNVATDNWSWQASPLSADDLARMARSLASDVAGVDWTQLAAEKQNWLAFISDRVRRAAATNAPNLSGGFMAVGPVIDVLFAVDLHVRGMVDAKMLRGSMQAVGAIAKKAASVSGELDARMSELAGVVAASERINRAAAVAEKLDVTMSELDEALKQISAAQQNTLKFQLEAEGAAKDAVGSKGVADRFAKQAAEVMSKIDAAYGAATTQGLAKSFDEKAKQLSGSLGIWVFVLCGALLIGVLVGQQRFPLLMKALEGKPDWGVVAMHMVISFLSLGPGIWLAWLATKQIGQRFRLAEDYAYKASLAKAYEGYRAQAASLDPMFSAQLFAIALGRLEELPLRTIDKEIAGSPLNDLLQSTEFKQQVEKLPGLKGIMIGLLQRVLPKDVIERWIADMEATSTKDQSSAGPEKK